MSGLEIIAVVASVVSAFHGASEIMKSIKERNKRKAEERQTQSKKQKTEAEIRAQIQQEMAQDQLVEVLFNGGVQIKNRYTYYYQYWTIPFQRGDGLVRQSLQMVATESKIMYDFLRAARDELKPLPPVAQLQELANKNRFNAQAALDSYHLRLLTEGAPIIPPNRGGTAEHNPQQYQDPFSQTRGYETMQNRMPQSTAPPQNHSPGVDFQDLGPAISLDGSPALPSFSSYVQHEEGPSPTGMPTKTPFHVAASPIWDLNGDAKSLSGDTLVNSPAALQTSLNVRPLFDRQTSAHSSQESQSRPHSSVDPLQYLENAYQNLALETRSRKEWSDGLQTRDRALSTVSVASRSTTASAEPTSPRPPQPRTNSGGFTLLNISSATVEGGTEFQGRPCKANSYHGFCKGAWSVQEDFKRGFEERKEPKTLYQFEVFFRCKHCKFEGAACSTNGGKTRVIDPRVYSAASGVRYKWAFLAKSHVSVKKEIHYRCIVCYFEGVKGHVFGNVDTLMNHIADRHKTMTPENQRRAKAVLGMTLDERDGFDIGIP